MELNSKKHVDHYAHPSKRRVTGRSRRDGDFEKARGTGLACRLGEATNRTTFGVVKWDRGFLLEGLNDGSSGVI